MCDNSNFFATIATEGQILKQNDSKLYQMRYNNHGNHDIAWK